MCESLHKAILIFGLSTGGLNTARGLTASFSGDLSSNRLHGFGPTARQLSLRSVYIVSNKKNKMKKRCPVRTTLFAKWLVTLAATHPSVPLVSALGAFRTVLGGLLIVTAVLARFALVLLRAVEHLLEARCSSFFGQGLVTFAQDVGVQHVVGIVHSDGWCYGQVAQEGEGKDQDFHSVFAGGFNPASCII